MFICKELGSQETLAVDAGIWGQGASWRLSPEGGSSRGTPRLEDLGSCPPGSEVSLGCRLPPPPLHSRIEVGVPGRSPAGQAFLPREQEAELRPSNLLLEVRGQGRPSRPHFLQPRPTPCGPRVYGNSGLDGFSEIIRLLCPYLTPRAQRGTGAGVLGSMGREGSPSQRAQIWPQSHFLFKLGFYGSGSGFSVSPA